MKIIAIILTALLVVGCSTTKPIVNQTQVIVHQPPTTLFNCPQVKNFPVEGTVTNRDIANTVEKLYSANRTCGANMNAIQQNLKEATEIYSN